MVVPILYINKNSDIMSVITISIIAALGFGLFFIFLSLISKRTDYLLDDYNEDDKPDNVRIIERDILKYVEKKVEVENKSEIERLAIELDKLTSMNNDLVSNLDSKNVELETLLNDINVIKSDKESYKLELDKIIEEREKLIAENNSLSNEVQSLVENSENLNGSINNLESDIFKLNKEIEIYDNSLIEHRRIEESLNVERDNLSKLNDSLLNDVKKINQEKGKIEVEYNDTIDKLNQDIKDKDNQIDEIIKSLEVERDSNSKIIKDRDYFIEIVERKNKEINTMKNNLNYDHQKHPNVYEGIDEYGKFYDISRVHDYIDPKYADKIVNIMEQNDPDQFTYYAINTDNGFENIETHSINNILSFVDRVSNKKTRGKYKTFIIIDNRVYCYEVH